MSEQTAETTETAATGTSTEQDPNGQGQQKQQAQSETKPTETVDFWKGEARKQEKRAKENADAAKRLGEIEEAQKTESQKAADRLSKAEGDLTAATDRANRAEVALDKGLTLSQARRLVGTTREELEADADELLKDIGTPAKRGNHVPGEGRTSTPKSGEEDRRAFVRQLTGRD